MQKEINKPPAIDATEYWHLKSNIESIKEKYNIEKSRFKQDCRKRALDLAHQQVTSPVFQKYIEDNEFISKEKKEVPKTNVQDNLITTIADKYYNWLISISEK